MKLSILMPCLNEALTLPTCIHRAQKLFDQYSIDGEILISDNGSTDGSQEIALKLGARVVHCPILGYGAALQYGIENAQGDYVIMGDSDDSYHFDEAHPMLQKLEAGYDVCMGTRLKGTIMPGAMPKLNRLIGNPVLTFIGRLLFRIDITDFHCGMRGFRRDKILDICLVTTGMEWASEMIIKSKLNGLKMVEVPVTLYKDGRNRPPHLRRWRDGWRHLRFMLLHAPLWLFVFPGLCLVSIATILGIMLIQGPIRIGAANLDVHSLLTLSFLSILGVQMIFSGLFANLYGCLNGILPVNAPFLSRLKIFSLEKLLFIALIIGGIGASCFATTIYDWYSSGFPELDYRITMRCIIPALTLMAIATQAIVNGFMLSLLFLKTKSSLAKTIIES